MTYIRHRWDQSGRGRQLGGKEQREKSETDRRGEKLLRKTGRNSEGTKTPQEINTGKLLIHLITITQEKYKGE